MKYSRQRELIWHALQQTRSHPTADQLYQSVRAKEPHLSLGTVYRNLNLLVEQGRARRISVPNGSDRFDAAAWEHYHIICGQCGTISDIMLDCVDRIDEEVKEKTGFETATHQLVLYGICNECKNKKERG